MSSKMPGEVTLLPSGVQLQYLAYEDSDNEDTMDSMPKSLMFKSDSDSELPASQGSNHSQSFGTETSNRRRSDIDLLMSALKYTSENEASEFILPTSPAPIPRSRTPVEGLSGVVSDLADSMNQVTPTKPPNDHHDVDPLTPTANLKVLISAASPEIRNREKLKQLYSTEIDTSSESQDSSDSLPAQLVKGNNKKGGGSKFRRHMSCDDKMFSSDPDVGDGMNQSVSRKEKSLGLLCQRFLSKYPENPGPFDRIEISLDEVAKELAVERRRIYDIVNVLESVEIVSRIAKNRYMWHGKTNLKHTLAKLKSLGQMEGFAEQIERLRNYEVSPQPSPIAGSCSPRKKVPFQSNEDSNLQADGTLKDNLRKEKSLGIMSQKFLMLFLVAKNHTVNLDLSAKILIGESNTEKAESSLKTKVRRLYDIANILTSLDLIRKVHVTEIKGRKPAFKYVGPDVDELKKVTACAGDGCHRPTSRHSLLDCIQNPQVGNMLNAHKSFHPSSRMSLLSQPLDLSNKTEKVTSKRSFSRHASFEQICEVAEQERNRLYFESKSQPSSPNKSKRPILPKRIPSMPCPKVKSLLSPSEYGNQSDAVRSSIRQLVMQRGKQDGAGHEETVCQDETKEPTQTNASGKTMAGAQAASSRNTVVTLTREQLEAMLQKWNSGKRSVNHADAATQSSPGLSKGLLSIVKGNNERNKASSSNKRVNIIQNGPQVKIVRVQSFPPASASKTKINSYSSQTITPPDESIQPSCNKRQLEEPSAECYFEAKRPRIDITAQSNIQDIEVAKINHVRAGHMEPIKPKRSPNRALHMDPEFQMSPPRVEVPVQRTPTPETKTESIEAKIMQQDLMCTEPGLPPPMKEIPQEAARERQIVVQLPHQESLRNDIPTLGSTPTFRISNTSPPVMFLAASPAAGSLVTSQQSAVPLPTGRITSASLTVGSSGIGALQSTSVQPCTLSPAFLTGLASPVPISASPVGFVTTPTIIDNITPVTTFPRLKKNGIMPSSSTIINLIPHLDNSPPHGQGQIGSMALGLAPGIVNQKVMSKSCVNYELPQTAAHDLSSSGDVYKTPVERIGNLSIISPLNNTTPSTQTSKPLATPTSFFRSTPGGLAPASLSRAVLGQTNASAFHIVVSQAAGPTAMPEGVTIARRLALHHEDTA